MHSKQNHVLAITCSGCRFLFQLLRGRRACLQHLLHVGRRLLPFVLQVRQHWTRFPLRQGAKEDIEYFYGDCTWDIFAKNGEKGIVQQQSLDIIFGVYVVLLHTGSTSPKKLEDFAWIGLKPRKTPWKRVKTHALAAGRPYVWTLSPELKRLPNEKLLTENVTSKFCQNDRFLPPKWPVFALRIGNIMRVIKVHMYDCTASCDCF